jgi:HNH endonuclease.
MPPQTADYDANMALTEPLYLSGDKEKISFMSDQKTDAQLRVEAEFGVPIYDLFDILFTQLEYTYDEISERISVPRRTVNTWINDLGVTDYAGRMDADVDELDRGRAMFKAELQVGEPLDEWLFEQYWVERRSTYDIREEFGSADNTIAQWMKRLNVSLRDDAEQFANHWDSLNDDEKEQWMDKRVENGLKDEDGSCLDEWRDNNGGGRGQSHPRWKGMGEVTNKVRHLLSDEPWKTQTKMLRKETEYECELCGVHQRECTQQHHIHHIVPLLSGGVNVDENLMVLCSECHFQVEWFTNDWFKTVLTDNI